MSAKRMLLKMSGEAVAHVGAVFSVERLDSFATQVAKAMEADEEIQIGVVVGGGNVLRGADVLGVTRVKADQMGMLATVINGLALQDALARVSVDAKLMTGVAIPTIADTYVHHDALRALDRDRIVIFAGGIGNPYFTTDTAGALRAIEVDADILLLAKFGTDGVYDKDPNAYADAVKYKRISLDVAVSEDLRVMDSTALSLCRDNAMPIYVFDMKADNAVYDALLGDRDAGTLIMASHARVS